MSTPSISAARCGLRHGLTFRMPIGGTTRDCMTLPVNATTGNVWIIADGTQVMEVPLFGPEGVMDVGAVLLDSPWAMCFAARYLATRHGLNPGDTAPLWTFEQSQPAPRDLDGTPCHEDAPEMWTLVARDAAVIFVDVDSTLPEGAPSWYPDDWIVIPGISKLPPAEALAAAINALK